MTLMWIIILISVVLCSVLGLLYLINQTSKFTIINRLSSGRKSVRYLYASLLLIISIVALWGLLGYTNMCVILICLTLFWIFSDFLFFIIKKVKGSLPVNYKNYVGITALLITFIYLSFGWFFAHNVVETDYTITSQKAVKPLKILQFSDSHIGTTFDGEGFKKHIETMRDINPDIILITGDLIDGSTKYQDTVTSIEALGTLTPKYGIYFCFGNHDKNYYGEDSKRDFTTAELIELLEKNNITVLEDEIVNFEEGYTLIGRQDKSEADRMSVKDLMSEISIENFTIDINHQPNDYNNEEAAGVDLVLSGHTHGGQFFPINEFGVWIKANDKTYGYEKRSDTNFIVSSGISDWALDFKTGCKSEIVVINIVPE